MKKTILFKIFYLLVVTTIHAQEKPKDTLFFALEKYYTISPTITPNISNQKYLEWHKTTDEQMKHVGTNGYIYFIGNGFLNTGLKPKKIQSIKDYIENKKFYMDGKYNNVIDAYKLNDSLLGKYIIFFVNGGEFIQPRSIEYKTFYPRRNQNGEFIANPNVKKDTLYFNFDNKYVMPSKHTKNRIVLNENICQGGGAFYFEEKQKMANLPSPGQFLDLKNYIQSSQFYESKNKSFQCVGFSYYIDNYVVIFVRKEEGKVEFIKVQAQYVIED